MSIKRPRISHYTGGRVCASLTAAQRAGLEAVAEAADLPLPEMVRQCIDRAIPLLKESQQKDRRADRRSGRSPSRRGRSAGGRKPPQSSFVPGALKPFSDRLRAGAFTIQEV